MGRKVELDMEGGGKMNDCLALRRHRTLATIKPNGRPWFDIAT
jgi:hypothetical protein